ncbi:hypothetical protein [Ralstonia mannitolilytica]|uniref:hypothetical protein n=1 Tax=Ralstonia mannitolilytica TaxID=105219 RepID=UPI00292CC603|nr:hypothetical protein [Ralstonia mannitolilytica]
MHSLRDRLQGACPAVFDERVVGQPLVACPRDQHQLERDAQHHQAEQHADQQFDQRRTARRPGERAWHFSDLLSD